MSDPVPAIAEASATGAVAEIFADIRTVLGVEVVNLIWRHLVTIPDALPWAWGMLRPLYADGTIRPLDRAAGDAIARGRRAVVADEELRDQKQADTANSRRRVRPASQDQMHDVLGQVVVAGRYEDLCPCDLVGAVVLWHRPSAQEAEVGAAVRLSQTHGAGPDALHQLR
jgi:hypothetical protein